MAGLRKLRGKWYIRFHYSENGKSKEKLLPTGTSDKKVAEIERRKIEKQEISIKQHILDQQMLIDQVTTKPTIKKLTKSYLRHCKVRGLSPKTIRSYKHSLDDFIAVCGNKTTDQLERKLHYKLLEKLTDHYHPTTANIRIRSIKAFLNWLVETEEIEKLPFRLKQIPVEESLPKFLTPDELDKIYALAEKDYPLIASHFRVLEHTGMRRGEVENSQLESDGRHIRVSKTKGKKERLIPLPGHILPDYLAIKDNGYSPNFVSRKFTDYAKEVGVSDKKTLHSLRHTYALRKLVELGDVYRVKLLMGHSSVTTTEIYLKFPEDYLKGIFKSDTNDDQVVISKADYERFLDLKMESHHKLVN